MQLAAGKREGQSQTQGYGHATDMRRATDTPQRLQGSHRPSLDCLAIGQHALATAAALHDHIDSMALTWHYQLTEPIVWSKPHAHEVVLFMMGGWAGWWVGGWVGGWVGERASQRESGWLGGEGWVEVCCNWVG